MMLFTLPAMSVFLLYLLLLLLLLLLLYTGYRCTAQTAAYPRSQGAACPVAPLVQDRAPPQWAGWFSGTAATLGRLSVLHEGRHGAGSSLAARAAQSTPPKKGWSSCLLGLSLSLFSTCAVRVVIPAAPSPAAPTSPWYHSTAGTSSTSCPSSSKVEGRRSISIVM